MIQRKQSLFLFQLIFLGIALLFIPSLSIITQQGSVDVFFIPAKNGEFVSTAGHSAAIILNFLGLLFTFVTIFIYNKRELQIKLCYILILLWVVIGLMILFCPFVVINENMSAIKINYFVLIIAAVAIIAAYFAAKFIKKDIALLKSADRIR